MYESFESLDPKIQAEMAAIRFESEEKDRYSASPDRTANQLGAPGSE